MNYFCLRFLPEIDPQTTPCSWALLDSEGGVLEQGSHLLFELSERIEIDDGIRVIVLVSRNRVLTTDITIQAEHLRHLKKALPFMVEEQLADDIEDVHLAVPPNLKAGENSIAVVSHAELIHWLDLLYSVDLEPWLIAPEYLFVPDTGADLNLLFDEDQAILRTGKYSGSVVERDNIDVYLELHRAKNPELEIALYASAEDTAGKAAALGLERTLAAGNVSDADSDARPAVQSSSKLFQESVFSVLAVTAVRNIDSALNLLQGGYKVNTGANSPSAKWSAVAAVAAVFVVAELVLYMGSGFWFNQQADSYREDSVALYKELFPEEKRVVNPKLQFQSHLNQARATGLSTEFLGLLQSISELMPEEEEMTIKNLRYDAYGSGLSMALAATNIDELEDYKSALSNTGLDVELLSAGEAEDGIEGRIKVGMR